MIEVFKLSLNDFWSKKFIKLSVLPFLLSLFVLSFIMFFAGSNLSQALMNVLETGDFGYFSLADSEIFKMIVSSAILKFIVSSVFYLFGAYFALIVSMFVALVVVGFLTPFVVKEINLKHYNFELKDLPSNTLVVKTMFVYFFKFLGIFIISLPFLLLPIANFFIITIPFFYLYYKFLLIDVCSNSLNKTKFSLALIDGGGIKFVISCFLFYVLSLVPLMGLFFQLFFIIFLTHLIFRKYYIAF